MTTIEQFNKCINDHGVGSQKVKTFYANVCKRQDQTDIKLCTNTLEDMYMGMYSVEGEIAYELVKTYKK